MRDTRPVRGLMMVAVVVLMTSFTFHGTARAAGGAAGYRGLAKARGPVASTFRRRVQASMMDAWWGSWGVHRTPIGPVLIPWLSGGPGAAFELINGPIHDASKHVGAQVRDAAAPLLRAQPGGGGWFGNPMDR